jgi:hypothetical protein
MTVGSSAIEESLVRVNNHQDDDRLDLIAEEVKAKVFLRRDVRNR